MARSKSLDRLLERYLVTRIHVALPVRSFRLWADLGPSDEVPHPVMEYGTNGAERSEAKVAPHLPRGLSITLWALLGV